MPDMRQVEAANGHPVCPRCGGKRSRPEGRNRLFCQECRRSYTATTGHRKHAQWHRWTEGDEDILRRGWDNTKVTGCALAATIGVTYEAARHKAHLMVLFKRTDYRKRTWTPGEDGQLGEMIHRLAPATIARKLHRSTIAVCVRAKRLGLIRRVRDGWYTKREVCEILGMDHKWVQRRIDAGEIVASFHNGRKPERKGLAMWHIEENDLRDYIRSHAHELNGRNVDLVTIVGLFQ
ncbi:hypothetical protein LCGC14_1618600 [marine sediment metagenome]|uniref:C2H2-type domain-containing protein n=1 Tax=marine sediment metagenome TaxID=412755 RepID=A0A0F9I6G2_9ZZZZ